MDKASGCLSVVERTVWDGDQVLAEIRADGGIQSTAAAMECDGGCGMSRPALEGRVLYTTGAGLDHPLDVIRLDWYNDVVVPVYSWRGRAVDGICVNGSQFCTDFTWPARTESATFEDPPVTDPVYGGPIAWAGNIMDTQKDGSGLVYKRNRYYDPASGRFTQVDPIGLGGGLNAYGFGGGDQVSYTDPFGLCMDPKKSEAKCIADLIAAQDAARTNSAFQPGGDTHCNQATCQIVHKTGAPTAPLKDKSGDAALANTQIAKLGEKGSGWKEISAANAQNMANHGETVIAALPNPDGHGHVATVRPDDHQFHEGEGPLVANVGSDTDIKRVSKTGSQYGRDHVKYYIADSQ